LEQAIALKQTNFSQYTKGQVEVRRDLGLLIRPSEPTFLLDF
jgi:hypothetical protein